MPRVTCNVCRGSKLCNECRGAQGMVHPYFGPIGCGVCHAKGKCHHCDGHGYFEISQEEYDRREAARLIAEQEAIARKKAEAEAAHKQFQGAYNFNSSNESLVGFISKAQISGFREFNIVASDRDLINACEKLNSYGFSLSNDTQQRFQKALARREAERVKAENIARQRAAEAAEQRKLAEEKEAARRKAEAARLALHRFIKRGITVTILSAVSGALYYINTPQWKDHLYKTTKKIVNSSFYGKEYSVAHVPGYSIVLKLNLHDSEKLINARQLIEKNEFKRFKLVKDPSSLEAPKGTYAVQTDATNVAVIVADPALLGKGTLRSLWETSPIDKDKRAVFVYEPKQQLQRRQIKNLHEIAGDNIDFKPWWGTTVLHGDKVLYRVPVKLVIYLPKDNRFDLIGSRHSKAGS